MSDRPGGRREPTRSDRTGRFKEKPQNERDLEQVISFVNEIVTSTMAMNAQLGFQIKDMGSAIIDLSEKLGTSQESTDTTRKALVNVLNSPQYVKTLKKGTEDQTKQLSGLNLKFNLMSTFMSGILSGFEPIFDVVEEVGQLIGESLRPLMSTIAEGLITWLPVLSGVLLGVSTVITPLAEAVGQLIAFLSPTNEEEGLVSARGKVFGEQTSGFISEVLGATPTGVAFASTEFFLNLFIEAINANTEALGDTTVVQSEFD